MAHESDAASLLDELRRDDELDAEHERDALARVEQRLMLRLIEGGTGEAAERPPLHQRYAPPSRWWRGARGGMAAALLVGTALGAGGHAVATFIVTRMQATAAAPQETPATKARPGEARHAREPVSSTRAEAAATETDIGAPSTDAAEIATPPAASPKSPTAPSSARRGIELELSELEQARRAVSQGEGPSALRVLARHRQRYPSSVLAQEREALTVKALVLAGRHDEARKVAASFKANHPSSMLLDSVERSLGSIP
jgi:hypothetical protein